MLSNDPRARIDQGRGLGMPTKWILLDFIYFPRIRWLGNITYAALVAPEIGQPGDQILAGGVPARQSLGRSGYFVHLSNRKDTRN